MEVVKLIQPDEFGDNFIFEAGKWKVKFPPIATSGVEVSKDANNLITLGGDGGMFADATRLHAYALVQDNENMKIHLYRHQADLEFDVANATLINSVDMLELNGQFDDITITDAVVTFKDVQTDTELEFDTDQFQNVSGLTSDDSISLDTFTSPNYMVLQPQVYGDPLKVYRDTTIEVTSTDGLVGLGFIIGSEIGEGEIQQLIEEQLSGIIDFKWSTIYRNTTNSLLKITIRGILADVISGELYISDEEGYAPSNPSLRLVGPSLLEFWLSPADENLVETSSKQIAVALRDYDNLVENTPEGLLVLPLDGVHIDHTLEARSYQNDMPDDELEIEEFIRSVNGNKIHIPAVTLKNSRGKTLAAIVAPISEKLPFPTTDRITIDTNTSVLDSRVLINGVDKGSFVDLSLNQIPELQFTLISVSSYSSGGGGYVDGGYEVDPYNEGSYSGDGYNDSYGGDGYTIETEGYQFIVRNNTQKRLRVTIDGFNAINLTAHSDGINCLALGSDKIGFDLTPRKTDGVSVYFAFCNEDGVALSMAERDVLHEGGSSVNLMATYLNYNIDAPVINVNVNGNNQTLYAGNSTLFNVTLPSIGDYLNLYYRPEIEVTAVNGSPIDAPIYIDAIAVKGMNSMPPMTVTSDGLSIPYACEESAWNNTLHYVYRPVEGNDMAIVSSGREFSINLHSRFANMDVIYDSDDVPLGQQQIGKLDNSGSINFTIKQLIPRTDGDAIIGIRDNSIDNFYINIAVNRM